MVNYYSFSRLIILTRPDERGGQPGQCPGAQGKEGGSEQREGAQRNESIVQFYYDSKFQDPRMSAHSPYLTDYCREEFVKF